MPLSHSKVRCVFLNLYYTKYLGTYEIFQWLPAYTLGASTMFRDLEPSMNLLQLDLSIAHMGRYRLAPGLD